MLAYATGQRARPRRTGLARAIGRYGSVFGLAIVLALAGCGNGAGRDGSANHEANGDDDTKPLAVEIAVAERGDIVAAYSGTAALEAYQEAAVVAKVEGQIDAVLVEEGDSVKKGQVLAKLDGDRLRLRLEQARANLAKVERDYKRNIELHEKGLVASSAFEGLKYDLDSLQASYNMARLEYDYSSIVAPIDGVVSERMIKVGNTIAVNTPCFRITDLTPLVAYLHIPEREFGKIAGGQPVDVSVDALQRKVFKGVVARISPLVDSATGTFKATIEMDPEDTGLKPGMFARMSIVFDSRPDSILIPQTALTETDAGTAVFVVADDVAERRIVDTGFSWRGQLEVLSGVDAGERVVVIGQTGLKNGASVRIVGDPATPEDEIADDASDSAEETDESDSVTTSQAAL